MRREPGLLTIVRNSSSSLHDMKMGAWGGCAAPNLLFVQFSSLNRSFDVASPALIHGSGTLLQLYGMNARPSIAHASANAGEFCAAQQERRLVSTQSMAPHRGARGEGGG
jgi:hypothetical protein